MIHGKGRRCADRRWPSRRCPLPRIVPAHAPQVTQDPVDDSDFPHHRHWQHLHAALRAQHRVHLEDLAQQSSPVTAARSRGRGTFRRLPPPRFWSSSRKVMVPLATVVAIELETTALESAAANRRDTARFVSPLLYLPNAGQRPREPVNPAADGQFGNPMARIQTRSCRRRDPLSCQLPREHYRAREFTRLSTWPAKGPRS